MHVCIFVCFCLSGRHAADYTCLQAARNHSGQEPVTLEDMKIILGCIPDYYWTKKRDCAAVLLFFHTGEFSGVFTTLAHAQFF